MERGENCYLSAFDTLFARNVPHILEHIFFSLDYKSFKMCTSVNKTWRELLTSPRYQNELKEMRIEKKKNEEKLYSASQEGNAEEVRRLIHNHGVDVNFKMGSGSRWDSRFEMREGRWQTTPLIEATRKSHIEIVKILLDAGADIDRAPKETTNLPLALKASAFLLGTGRHPWVAKHHKRIKLLLDTGAKVDKASSWGGSTPLWWVEREDVARTLLEHGANPNKADGWGNTPLHWAAKMGRAAVTIILIEGGADPDRRNTSGKTPLETARDYREGQIVDIQ